MKRASLAEAVSLLCSADPVIDDLVRRYGPPRLVSAERGATRFESLVRAIVYQQLAGRAAASIHERLVGSLGGRVTPASILLAGTEVLRGAGLSGAKAASVTDLAAKVDSGIVRLERIGRLSDDEIVDHLVQVRGIGRWTAEMFLLFTLGRMDVWPVGDFGVRAGFAAAWSLPEPPTPPELQELGSRFSPYRSLVAWYCWRVADELRARRPVASGRLPAL